MTTIAFIGLGAMGTPMATNLIGAGFKLRVHNRTAQRMQPLIERGATACATPSEAAQGADFIVSIVADDVATREVMLGEQGVVQAAKPGAVIIDCSTNTPGMAREVARAAAARGVKHLDAPVSGSIPQAKGRELVFMVGGDVATFEAAKPVFDAMGRMTRRVGDSGAGATTKLVNNLLSATATAIIAEAWSVAEAAGLDPAATAEVLFEGAGASRLTRTKLPKIQSRDFTPQFQLALMEKDLRYFMALATEADRPVPIAALVRNQLQAARRAELGKLDVSAVFLHITGEARKG